MCTRHADAGVVPDAVQAGALVLTGVRGALVDVLLTAWPGIAAHAVTRERAVRVHTLTAVLTGVGAWRVERAPRYISIYRERKDSVTLEYRERGRNVLQ